MRARTYSMQSSAVLLVLSIAVLPLRASMPTAKPEDVGLAADRVQRIDDAARRHIEAQNVAGVVVAVARRGKIVHLSAHGMMDLETKKPMARDAIFRIASMTKPVIGVAVVMMMEEGKLRLTDPVSRFIPEFKDTKVAVALPAPAGRGGAAAAPATASGGGRGRGGPPPAFYTIPAAREITVRDLLTHTSGFASGAMGNSEVGKIPRTPTDSLAGLIPRLASTPLEFQPGTRWAYSAAHGFDALARIVEIVSGQAIDQFLHQRIFAPLGMNDTFFVLPEAKQGRLAANYQRGAQGLQRTNADFLRSDTYFSGGGGLLSTAEDYLQFGQMLLNRGTLNGKRLLGSRTVGLMTTPWVHDFGGGPNSGRKFGLSVQIVEDPIAAVLPVGKGSFGWDGAFGTHFWVDPANEIVGVVMIQGNAPNLHRDIESAILQAIVD